MLKNIKFTTNEYESNELTQIIRILFPEFTNIERHGNSFTFSRYSPGTLSRFFANFIGETTSISLLELIVCHISKRLSTYKCGNISFSSLYLVNIITILNTKSEFLGSYIIHEFKKIQSPYAELNQSDFLRDLDEANSNTEFDIEKMKQLLIIAVDKPISPTVQNIMNRM